ncbi:hypothetical protein [Bacillus cereus group sp. BfR-BA-01326]|uniref:hypothetical protein n=1 Tax=Bacillus cereus group sp. BfR-BA-01326 TaxID=2920302 RepID=UPI001F5724B6|nr:hypothetical protein [Bacillus cereus group sp. BfR-BA-01326]
MNKYQVIFFVENSEAQRVLMLSDEEETSKVKQMLLQQISTASASTQLFVIPCAETGEDVAIKGTAIVGYRLKYVGKVKADE